MNKVRLLKLADLLIADAKNKKGIQFDLGVVGEAADWQNENFSAKLDCGTKACAMGLAAISGIFKRAGLSYEVNGRFIDTTMKGRRLQYDRAAMKLFGISIQEADFLFTPCSYNFTPQEATGERIVARRIRDFVAGKVAPQAEE